MEEGILEMKSIQISTINWCEKFTEVKGSYYDYVCRIASFDKETHQKITQELIDKGWEEIITKNDDLSVFEKDRHVIRVSKVWED